MSVAKNRHNSKNQFLTFFMGQLQRSSNKPGSTSGVGRSIYDLLRVQITDGTLPAGTQAPSTRGLATELGVSRTTVTAVYEQLAAEGYLVTSAGRAARVVKPLTAPAPSSLSRGRRAKTAPTLSDFGRRLQNLSLGSGRPAIRDVVPDRPAEQPRILQHHAHPRAQLPSRH